VYRAECAALGVTPAPPRGPALPVAFVHVSDDPDASWRRIAPHALHEMNSYGRWLAGSDTSHNHYRQLDDAEQARASGAYLVLTPEELVDRARELGPTGRLGCHPLMGGLPPEESWASLELIEHRVLPRLRKAQLH
jgi:hypothetical protein